MQGDERLGVRETVEGVEIEKRYDDEEFPFPSIVYKIASGREERVTLRIEDEVPPGVDTGNVGFHRAFGGEHWSIDGDHLVFESALEPGATAKSVYALSAPGTADPDVLFAEPVAIEVEPPVDDPTSRAGESEWMTNPAAGDDGGVDEASGNGTDPEPAGSDGAVASLARELETGVYDDSDLETVIQAVTGANGTGSGHMEARLAQLEDDVTELRAYTGALEALLDGGDSDELAELPQRLATIESDLETLQAETDGAGADDEVVAEVESLSEKVASLETTLRDVEARLDEAESFLDEIRAALG